MAKAAGSVATAVSEHERGVIQQGQHGTEERDPVGEGGGAQHPSRAGLLLGNDHAVFGEQAQRTAARIELDRGRYQLEKDDGRKRNNPARAT